MGGILHMMNLDGGFLLLDFHVTQGTAMVFFHSRTRMASKRVV